MNLVVRFAVRVISRKCSHTDLGHPSEISLLFSVTPFAMLSVERVRGKQVTGEEKGNDRREREISETWDMKGEEREGGGE